MSNFVTKSYKYEVNDGCYGYVVNRIKNGVIVELDNGELAVGWRFENLFPGTKVLCNIIKLGDGIKKPVVNIEAVFEDILYAA